MRVSTSSLTAPDCTCRVTALAFGEALHSACDYSPVTLVWVSNRKSVTVSTARAGGGTYRGYFAAMGRATAALAPNPLRRICALWTPVLRVKFWLLTVRDAFSQDALSFQGEEQFDYYPGEQQSKPFGPSITPTCPPHNPLTALRLSCHRMVTHFIVCDRSSVLRRCISSASRSS